MRDALIAASTLNIFNNHSDRVRMANLAQTINVLQALVLTDKEKILLTPTYYVFKMFKAHHDSKLLKTTTISCDYKCGNEGIPEVNVSASLDKDGKIHATLVNLHPNKAVATDVVLNGMKIKQIKGEVLTSQLYTDYNSFDKPNKISVASFDKFKKDGDNVITVKMPPLSVVALEIF